MQVQNTSTQGKQNAKQRSCPWAHQIMPPLISRFYLRNKPWQLKNISSALCSRDFVYKYKGCKKAINRLNLQLLPHVLCTSSEDTDRGRKREERVFFWWSKCALCISPHSANNSFEHNIKIHFSASLENPLQAEPLWEHLKQLLLKVLSPPITHSVCFTLKSSLLVLFSIEF